MRCVCIVTEPAGVESASDGDHDSVRVSVCSWVQTPFSTYQLESIEGAEPFGSHSGAANVSTMF